MSYDGLVQEESLNSNLSVLICVMKNHIYFLGVYSPSGEKKVLDPKQPPDMNGYQIRV